MQTWRARFRIKRFVFGSQPQILVDRAVKSQKCRQTYTIGRSFDALRALFVNSAETPQYADYGTWYRPHNEKNTGAFAESHNKISWDDGDDGDDGDDEALFQNHDDDSVINTKSLDEV